MSFRQGVDDKPAGSPPMIGKLLSDADWLAYLESYAFGVIAPDRVVLHHTWVPTLGSWRGLSTMKGMQTYYRSKGWSAAPHIYVAPEGIWLFTPLDSVGIHAGTGNSGNWHGRLAWYSIGVEMVGDYDKVRPSGSVWQHTQVVVGSLLRRFGKTPEQALAFHRDFTDTKSCPGWAVTKPWVFGEVSAWLSSTNLGLVQLPVLSVPRISQAKFADVLKVVGSPAYPHAVGLYAICAGQGVDPAVALAFFGHESTFGTAGLTRQFDLRNWGNVRTPEDVALGKVLAIPGRGNFAQYQTWQAGLLDWCKRIKGPKYAGAGLTTVETIVPKYAPSSDGNAPVNYVRAVRGLVTAWETSEVKDTKTVTIMVDALRIREGAAVKKPDGTPYAIVGLLHKDEKVQVDGTKDEGRGLWWHLADGRGFISTEYALA